MDESGALNIEALSPTECAALLSESPGEPVSVAAIERDIAAGCPVNTDGTLSLIVYAAWLTGELRRG